MLDIVRVSGPPVRSCRKGGKVSAYDLVIRAGPLDRLGLRRPEMHFDLPGGGRRLLQRAEGYPDTFVGDQETYAAGEPTGAMPGRLVRGAQPAPAGS